MQARAAARRRLFAVFAFAVLGGSDAASAVEPEVVTARFAELPRDKPIAVDDSGETDEDTIVAKEIRAKLREKGFKIIDDESEDGLLLTFHLDSFVPARPDDRSGFGVEVEGKSGEGVHARIVVPRLQKEFAFGPAAPPPVPGPILTLDMRLDEGSRRRLWLGRANQPLGHETVEAVWRRLARKLVNALAERPAPRPE